MIINVRNLKLNLKKSENYSLKETLSDELLSDLGGRFLSPCKVEITVEHVGKLYLCKGTVKADLELKCDRCLKEFAYQINAQLHFSLVESINENEFKEEDDDIVFFEDDKVDITPMVQEAIIVNIPIRILCREDCRGLCPQCGVDLNLEQCKCTADNIDPRWEKLKDFK